MGSPSFASFPFGKTRHTEAIEQGIEMARGVHLALGQDCESVCSATTFFLLEYRCCDDGVQIKTGAGATEPPLDLVHSFNVVVVVVVVVVQSKANQTKPKQTKSRALDASDLNPHTHTHTHTQCHLSAGVRCLDEGPQSGMTRCRSTSACCRAKCEPRTGVCCK